MLIVYIGSLVALAVAALFKLDSFTQAPTTELTTQNLTDAFTSWKALKLFGSTVLTAAVVTVICVLIAVPVSFFIAKVAPKWVRRTLMASMMLPLWAGYLVKTYAWRSMVAPAGGNKFAAAGRGGGGFLEGVLGWTPGYSRMAVIIALVYLWLPYMVLPIYAGLDRLPASFLDASSDLGGRSLRTFRSVIVPLLLPSIAAGSIFTFSLTLGDYIAPRIVTNGQLENRIMFGELIFATFGAPNQPLAAAYTLLPLAVIIVYLFAMRRAGAFDNL
jgi:putative spermidine/putrescine transport system permease protein